MTTARPELDGSRIKVADRPEVWLIFHGMRHHITSPAVYDALFIGIDGIIEIDNVENILEGPNLNEGTCLARGGPDSSICLVTGTPPARVRRYPIMTYEIFLKFNFSLELVQSVPSLIFEAVTVGRGIRANV